MSQHLRQQAYDHIHALIVSGRLAAGSRVSELSLAGQIGVSRTPVREAIRRLVHEGLLEQVPRLGTVVRAPQRRDIVELYEIREALEGHAVRQAADRITADELTRLTRLCDELRRLGRQLQESKARTLDAAGMRRFLAADLGFHMTLMRSAGNQRLLKLVADSRVLTGIFGTRRQEHDLAVVRETERYHRCILAAVKRRDGEAARKLLTAHIRASRDEALAHFDRPVLEQASRLPLGLPADVVAELDRLEQGMTGEKKKKQVRA
jgi:DNA-binding GntR family transcriptional regulator